MNPDGMTQWQVIIYHRFSARPFSAEECVEEAPLHPQFIP
jgi:hypothetical protein